MMPWQVTRPVPAARMRGMDRQTRNALVFAIFLIATMAILRVIEKALGRKQFSVRTMLWLTLLVAALVAFMVATGEW